MQQTIRISDDLIIGPQPPLGALDELGRSGVRSIVNLRQVGEPEQPLSPDAERREVEQRKMSYAHVPISGDRMDHVAIDELRKHLRRLPKPVYLHSWGGERSSAAAIMCLGVDQGWSGEQALKQAAELGVECSDRMARFVRAYVDQRLPGGAAAPSVTG